MPWAAIPPFPFLHAHAQWADVLFGASALLCATDWARAAGRTVSWPPSAFTWAVLAHVAWAGVSWACAEADARAPATHLLGIAELGALALLAARFGAEAGFRRALGWVGGLTAATLTASALTGVALHTVGIGTVLIGTRGDLEPGSWPRVQAATWHPNLLASLCVFFWACVAQADSPFSGRARRAMSAGLLLTTGLAFSRTLLSLAATVAAAHLWGTGRRRAAVLALTATAALLVALTFVNLRLDPAHPTGARLDPDPTPRRTALVTSWSTFRAHPLTGLGPGRSPGFYEGWPFDAHFTALNLAATLGGPGLLTFLALPVLAWRAGAREPAFRFGLLALALDALAADVEEFRHLFLLLGLCAARRGGGP